ncbi:hypothetical protein DFH07DRAFT_771648 [Mycena maculata]|uniref:Uncharacterized protein n=1 Tax=Mycena maculata TaxID=230809 RepID=A0AAD7JC85_9AGAR|nr:hypothetical protein DFH07DRAFT_771648 [Mycena maculata]
MRHRTLPFLGAVEAQGVVREANEGGVEKEWVAGGAAHRALEFVEGQEPRRQCWNQTRARWEKGGWWGFQRSQPPKRTTITQRGAVLQGGRGDRNVGGLAGAQGSRSLVEGVEPEPEMTRPRRHKEQRQWTQERTKEPSVLFLMGQYCLPEQNDICVLAHRDYQTFLGVCNVDCVSPQAVLDKVSWQEKKGEVIMQMVEGFGAPLLI